MRWESIEASADRNFLACIASVKGGGGGGGGEGGKVRKKRRREKNKQWGLGRSLLLFVTIPPLPL